MKTDLIGEKKTCARVIHFFVHFFVVVLHDYNVTLLVHVTRFMEEISYVLRFAFFLHCGLFSSWWPLALLIFSAAITAACFLSDEIRLRHFFFFRSSTFFVIHIDVGIKF